MADNHIVRLDVQVSHRLRVGLDETLARWHGWSHQLVEGVVGLDRIFHVYSEQRPGLGIHRGLPELLRVHLPQTLVALDLHLSVSNLLQQTLLLLLAVHIVLL